MDSSKKIYYGVVLEKTQLENTQGQAKELPFFHPLSASVSHLFLCLFIQQSWEHSGVAGKERESEAMSE